MIEESTIHFFDAKNKDTFVGSIHCSTADVFANCGSGLISMTGFINNGKYESSMFTQTGKHPKTYEEEKEFFEVQQWLSKAITYFLCMQETAPWFKVSKERQQQPRIICYSSCDEPKEFLEDWLNWTGDPFSNFIASDVIVPKKEFYGDALRAARYPKEFHKSLITGQICDYGGWKRIGKSWKNCNTGNELQFWQLVLNNYEI